MTLEELQIVIIANISQIKPQIDELKSQLSTIQGAATSVSEKTTQAVKQSAEQAQRALEKANSAEQSSADSTVKAVEKKKNAYEGLDEVIARTMAREQEIYAGSGNEGPLHEPVQLSGAAPTAFERTMPREAPAEETPDAEPQLNALQRLQQAAGRIRDSFASMFTGAKASADSADSAIGRLTSKLDIANQRIELYRQKLIELQAEYGRAVAAGGEDSPAAAKLQEQILSTRSRLVSLRSEAAKTSEQIDKLNAGLDETGSAGNRAAGGARRAGDAFGTASSKADGFQRMLGRVELQIFRNIVVYGLLIKGLQSLGSYMAAAMKTNTAFANSLNNLKVQFLTAFNPIYQAALPALTSLINALAKAMAYIAAFISGLFGTTYQKSQQSAASLNNNVKAIEDTTKVTKDAAKAAKDATAGFDESKLFTGIGAGIAAIASPAGLAVIGLTALAGEMVYLFKTNKSFHDDVVSKWADIKKTFSTGWNFGPLKTALQNVQNALAPLTKTIWDGIAWGLTNVLAPLAKWTVSQVLPAFLNILAGAIKVLNSVINAMKPLGEWLFNNFLKPIAQWTGGVIVKVLNGITGALNSISAWIDVHQPAVQNIAIVVGSFAAAWGLVNAAIAVWNVIGAIATGVTGAFGAAVAILTSPITIVILAIGALIAAVVLCIKYWPQISEAAGKAWDAIVRAWSGAVKWFGDIWNGIVKVFSVVGSWFGKTFSDAWNGIKKIWSVVVGWFQTLWNGIVTVFSVVGSWFEKVFSDAWNGIKTVWSVVVSWFKGVWDGIVQVFNVVSAWFGKVFSDAWNGIKTVWSVVIGWFQSIWDGIVKVFSVVGKWFSDTFSAAWGGIKMAWSAVVGWFQGIWDGIKKVFNTVASWFGKVFSDAWSEIQKAWSSVVNWFQGIWNGIVRAFSNADSWFNNLFQKAWDGIKNIWNGVADWFSGVWNGITRVFSSASSWFGGTFQNAYNSVTKVWNNLGGFFGGIWSGVQKGWNNFWGGLWGGFKGFINDIIGGVNTLIKGLDKLQFNPPAWVPGMGGKTFGFNIPTIPRLASGGLAYSQTLALVGDNPGAASNPEVIAPLDKLKSLMNNDNGEVVTVLRTILDAINDKDMTVNLDGKPLAKSVNKANRASGVSILGGAFAT